MNDKNYPQNDVEIKKYVKTLHRRLSLNIFCLCISVGFTILELSMILTVDFIKFDFISFLLMLGFGFVFYRSFKDASLTARELVIYKNML